MTNQTTGQVADDPFPPTVIVFIVLQQLVFVFACVGNGMVVFIFTRYLHLKSFTNRFVVSLATADFCTGISVGSQLLYFLSPSLNANKTACFVRYQIIACMTLTSQLTVALTTFDRYIAICHPHNYNKMMTNLSVNILVTVPWVYAIILSSLSYLGLKPWTSDSVFCIYHLLFENGVFLTAALTMVVFSVASFVMYMCILRVAWRYYQRIRPSNVAPPNLQVRKKSTERDVRGAKVMGIVTLAFTVCWAPFTAYQFRYGVGFVDLNMEDMTASNWLVFLGMANSLVNPFIYAWQRKDFSMACKKLCGRNVEGSNPTGGFTSHVSST